MGTKNCEGVPVVTLDELFELIERQARHMRRHRLYRKGSEPGMEEENALSFRLQTSVLWSRFTNFRRQFGWMSPITRLNCSEAGKS